MFIYVLVLYSVLPIALVILGAQLIKNGKSIKSGVPLTRANTADLPTSDSLVRASHEPLQAQESVLLRAALETTQTQEEQLLRASTREKE